MIQPDGTALCDNCGHAEPNDSITAFAKLSDLVNDDNGLRPVVWLACRANDCAADLLAGIPWTYFKGEHPPKEDQSAEQRTDPAAG